MRTSWNELSKETSRRDVSLKKWHDLYRKTPDRFEMLMRINNLNCCNVATNLRQRKVSELLVRTNNFNCQYALTFEFTHRCVNLSWKHHYADGLYKQAAEVLGLSNSMLRQYKSLADRFQLYERSHNLSWNHHWEVASIKRIKENGYEILYQLWK